MKSGYFELKETWKSSLLRQRHQNDNNKQMEKIDTDYNRRTWKGWANSYRLNVSDARKDLDSVKAVYNKLVEDGEKLEEGFLQHYNHILMKNSGGISLPSHTGSTVKVKRVRPQVLLNTEFQERGHSSHAVSLGKCAFLEPHMWKSRCSKLFFLAHRLKIFTERFVSLKYIGASSYFISI